MQLDVVGVAVAAEGVVADDDLRPVATNGRDNLADDFLHRRLAKAAFVLVVGRTGHAAVAVAQPVHALQPQRLRCAAKLGSPQLRGVGVVGQHLRVHRAGVAVGAAHQPDIDALGGIARQRAARPEGLVVRVSKDGQKRAAGARCCRVCCHRFLLKRRCTPRPECIAY